MVISIFILAIFHVIDFCLDSLSVNLCVLDVNTSSLHNVNVDFSSFSVLFEFIYSSPSVALFTSPYAFEQRESIGIGLKENA